MLTAAQETQLTGRLGPSSFTNIFSHTTGDGKTIADFYAATAGKGPTLLVLSVYGSAYGVPSNLPPQVIGGYNPHSWTPGGVNTPLDADRTAFIFNFKSGTIQAQNLIGQGQPDSGLCQTYAGNMAAIQFGGSDGDLMVHWELDEGWATNYSYGGTSGKAPITVGSAVVLQPPKDSFVVTQLDVYKVASSGLQAPSNAKVIVN